MKKAILICNIGTPEAPDRDSVKKYLDEFLMDEKVISAPWIIRYPLVRWLITPRRSGKSAEKYQAVWMKEGSPLLVYTDRLVQKLQNLLGNDFIVKTAMRYSQPSLTSVLDDLKKQKIQDILVVPMFPQFAQATTGSLVETFQELNKSYGFQMRFFKPFFSPDWFIDSFVQVVQKSTTEGGFKYDHLLFSYHGLPESQVKAQAPQCLREKNCCDLPSSCAMNCYRAQCVSTTKHMAQKLGLREDQYSLSFQSRLGPVKWIQPYTEDVLVNLAKRGVKNLAVVCPSFVTDCIETLEEIGMEGKETFLHAGGKEFHLVPCLNDDSFWAEKFAQVLEKE